MRLTVSSQNLIGTWIVFLCAMFSFLVYCPNGPTAIASSFLPTVVVWGIVMSRQLRQLNRSYPRWIYRGGADRFLESSFDVNTIKLVAIIFVFLLFGFLVVGGRALLVMVQTFSSENALLSFFFFLCYGILFSLFAAYITGFGLFWISLRDGCPTKLVILYRWLSAICLPVLPFGLYVSFSVSRTLRKIKRSQQQLFVR